MVKYLKNGIIAQLVEHMPYKHGVIGSSPIGSTTQVLHELSCETFLIKKDPTLISAGSDFCYDR